MSDRRNRDRDRVDVKEKDGEISRKDEKSSSASSSGEISLSIDDTNALRIKLGLKPLDMKPSREKQEVDRWQERAENAEKDEESAKLMAKIFDAKDRRKMKERIRKIKKLAESDEEEDIDDAMAWINKSRRLEQDKEKAEQQARQYEDMEDEFGLSDLVNESVNVDQAKRAAYTSSDLKGLNVEHDLEEFGQGSTILTIKDTDVLEDEDDVLVNVNMVDDMKTKENVEAAKLRPQYNAYDDNEFDKDGQPLPKAGVLAKYDEEIDGKKAQKFVLGDHGVAAKDEDVERRKKVLADLKASVQSVAHIAVSERADTFTENEMVAFKKPSKKKKKKKSRRLKADDLLDNADLSIPDNKDTQDGPRTWGGKAVNLDENVDDDDELRQALERTRRLKSASTRSEAEGRLESISANLAAKRKEEMLKGSPVDHKDNGKGMKISANIESIRTLGYVPGSQPTRKASNSAVGGTTKQTTTSLTRASTSNSVDIDGNAAMNVDEDVNVGVGESGMEVDDDISKTEGKSTWEGVGVAMETTVKPNTSEDLNANVDNSETFTLLDEAPLARGGMAAALNFARQRGMIKTTDDNVGGHVVIDDAIARQREKSKVENNEGDDYRTAREKERDKYRHRGGSVADRDRDRDNRDRDRGYDRPRPGDFPELKDYKPNVRLEYYDESGHKVDTKEAFRILSYKFHGITPGKAKIEKNMKKREEELSLNKMSTSDTPLQTVDKLRKKHESLGSAFVVLSGNQDRLDIKKTGKKREAEKESGKSSTLEKSFKKTRR
eukprot:CFRG8532T1